MKKLFALVLSLALVVAFAVPALATGWATLDTAPVYKEIGIAVYGLEVTPNTSKVGELYAELKTPYAVVKGTTLHFLVELTVPYANLSDAVKELIKVKGLDVKIATTNMTISKVELGGGNGWSLNADKDTITETYTNPNYSNKTVVFKYEVWANANSDKETKVVATAGFYNKWDNGKMEIYNAKGELAYTVFQGSNEFAVVNPAGKFVRFPVNSKGQIDTKGIMVNDQWLITFGSHASDTVFCERVEKRADGLYFTVRSPKYNGEFSITMPGLFNVSNALAAMAISMALGVPEDTVVTPALWARFLEHEHLHTRVLVNQADLPHGRELARRLAAGLCCPVCAAALQKEWIECLS